MDQEALDKIRFCAFCPNVCRIYYPTSGVSQKESLALSALAYLGYAVEQGIIEYSAEVDKVMGDLEGARKASEACPYNFDVPGLLGKYRQERSGNIN